MDIGLIKDIVIVVVASAALYYVIKNWRKEQ